MHLGLGIPVAVKILRPQAAALPAVVDGFRQEARAIARLDDENVLKVYDVVDEGNLHCMVMELLEGESVLDMITAQERLRVIDMLRVMRQAALGLSAAHAHGIVHRDVKPGNLVVLPNGSVKLVDFGLAVEQAATGTRVGTPHYMAPETCATGHSEAASDMYSLGVSMYHMLVGQPPHAGSTRDEIVRAHRDGKPMDLDAARPGLVRPILRLFDDLTARDPATRPTAPQVVAELDRIGGKRLSRTRSLRRKSGEGVGARVGAAALVLLLAVGAWALFGRGRGDAEPETKDGPAPADTPVVVVPAEPPPPAEPDAAELLLSERTEQEGEELLRGVESWARKNWQGRTDTPQVIKRYENISGPYTKTRAGIEAARRVEAIRAGSVHPHPDRAWSTPAEIEAARTALEAGGDARQALIASHRYREAKATLPARVSDPDGALETRLQKEHAYLDALVVFPDGLAARLAAAPGVPRDLVTKRGAGEVTSLGEAEIGVRIEGEDLTLGWEDVEPKAMARLGVRAFAGAPGQDVLPLLAFCVAHGLTNTFWEASMGVDLAGRPASEEALVRDLEARLSSR
jgi:serine/threonine-protein kinase